MDRVVDRGGEPDSTGSGRVGEALATRFSTGQVEGLISAALAAKAMAYAPYSGFQVGAALLCSDGSVYTGCNIENAAFGPSNCAERTAFFKAVSEGRRDFKAMAVCGGRAGEATRACPPCGVCRQVASEFCGPDFIFVLPDALGYQLLSLEDLLPYSFNLDAAEGGKD